MASRPAFELGSISATNSLGVTSILILVMTFVLLYTFSSSGSKLSEINPRKRFELTDGRRKREFMQKGKEIMLRGKEMFGKNLWKLHSEWGNVIVLPPEFIHELRSHPGLEFADAISDDNHCYVPGFDPLDGNRALPKVITKYLKKASAKLTKPISEEATLVLQEVFTDSREWHPINTQDDIFRIVSRLSTRVFMGEELCRDENWTKASAEYTAVTFPAGWQLGRWPRWARPIVHWFLPSCWEVRRKLAEARRVIQPHLDRRNALKAAAVARGDTSFVLDDSIEWFDEMYKEKYDPASEQILLSLVAIHTTSDLLQQTMIDLVCNEELFGPLRDEIVRVLSAEGLQKSAFYNLKLMDSVIKESQRMKPVFLSTFRRQATEDIKLSNAFIVQKGQKIIAANTHMWDSEYHENPDKYDGYRFFRMHGTDGERNAHLVSTSTSHPAFGHGKHACPGRFFAANEIKIALAHMLLKYEWKLEMGSDPKTVSFGMNLLPDPTVKLLVRRRKEEINMDDLAF